MKNKKRMTKQASSAGKGAGTSSSMFAKLSDLSKQTSPLSHLHHEGDGFRITSNVPIEKIADCDVLQSKQFGSFGCYFYPSDSVIEILNYKGDPQTFFKDELSVWKEQCDEDAFQDFVYHLSVESRHNDPIEGADEDEEEEELENGSEEEEENDELMDEIDKEEDWPSDDEVPKPGEEKSV